MTVAQFPSEVARRIYELIGDNKTSLLGVDGILLYGDQNRIPVTPTACVEAGEGARILAGVPSRTENTITCYIMLYWAKVDTNQNTKWDAEKKGEELARFLDGNLTLARGGDGGIVIHGHVTNIDPGYARRNDNKTLMHVVRLTWTGKSKTQLGA